MALTQKGAARRRKRTEELERPAYGWIYKPLLTLLVIYLAVCVGLGLWWSRTPTAFDVEQAVIDQRGAAAQTPASRGAVTVASLMTLIETLVEKPGGYLHNDIAPPGVWLDNMPAWELGVLTQARRLSVVLPAMEQADLPALDQVQERLAGDSGDWLYPSTEQRLNQALEALGGYLQVLDEEGEAAFGGRGQGLAAWLEALTRSLDDLGLRLSASIGPRAELRDLEIDAEALPARTPWYRVDDVFFEARGQAWAMLQLLRAVERDQADVLASAGLEARWEALVAELELSQRRLWSPLVLNGSGFGIFANHSLVLANHMIRARDLAGALAEGLAEVSSPPASEAAAEQDRDVSEATAPEAAVQADQDDSAASTSGTEEPAAEEGVPPEESAAPSGDTEAPSDGAGESSGAGDAAGDEAVAGDEDAEVVEEAPAEDPVIEPDEEEAPADAASSQAASQG